MENWKAKVRPMVGWIAALIFGIVWLSFHYTSGAFENAMTMIASDTTEEVRQGVIGLLTALLGLTVPFVAITGLVGPLNKLSDDPGDSEPVKIVKALIENGVLTQAKPGDGGGKPAGNRTPTNPGF